VEGRDAPFSFFFFFLDFSLPGKTVGCRHKESGAGLLLSSVGHAFQAQAVMDDRRCLAYFQAI
jgi:hypothetical protein